MEGICKRLNSNCVLVQTVGSDTVSIVTHLVQALQSCHPIDNAERLIDDIMSREQLASTCLGWGCAVPHAHSIGLEKSYLAAASLSEPLHVDTPDGEPVSLVFILVGPPKNASTHLKLLSKLARLLHDDELRNELRRATSSEEFVQAICKKENQ